jgi:ornithine decarboxylase
MHTTVIGIARRGDIRWAHLDVGAFNGMMESLETGLALRYPVTDARASASRTLFHLTGPTCDSQDTVLHDVPLSADLAVGDRLRIHVAGAYTTGYASRFNGFDIPPVHYPAP